MSLRRPPSDEEPRPGRRVPRRRTIVVAGLALVVVVLLVLPVFSTLQPGYYQRYPSLRARIGDWSSSTHGYMSCSGCHVDPGASSFLGFAARSIPSFYSQLLQGPQRTNLLHAPTRKACQKCHTSYREVSASGDLRIPHRAHVEVLKMECVVCHQQLVHYPSADGFNRPKMAMCLSQCHDGRKATADCVKCHTRKQVPASHRAPDWLATHSRMTEKIDCAECHAWSPDYCDDCHKKRPKSHVGNWKKGHAAPARERGKGCLVCHGGEKFCKRCHD